MKYTGVAKINNVPVQSVADKLRIAKNQTLRLRNSLVEIDKEIQLASGIAEGKLHGEQNILDYYNVLHLKS